MRPRCVLPGRTVLITRRCSDRRFFLTPSENVNQIVLYAIAKAAYLFGVSVHAWVAMSNHMHLVVTDLEGRLPDFMHALDLEIAKAVSAEIGRWGGFWESGKSYSAVDLLDDQAIIARIAYVHANPTGAGLVRRARRWPGATSVGFAFGSELTAIRPDTAYYRGSCQARSYTLRLVPPPALDPLECAVAVRAEVRHLEKRAEHRLKQEQRKFVGERRVLAQNPYDSPSSWERRRGRNPTFASTDRWRRVEAAQQSREWFAEYRSAWTAFCGRVRDVLFPAGTWVMRMRYRKVSTSLRPRASLFSEQLARAGVEVRVD